MQAIESSLNGRSWPFPLISWGGINHSDGGRRHETTQGRRSPVHGSDSVLSLRAAPRPAGRAAAGGWLSPWCRSSQGCPTGCCRRDVGLCGVPGSPVPLHPSPPCAGVRCLQPRCQGAVSLVGMREGPWRCREAAALGRTPLTSPAAGPGWEGSFSGQRRAAAPRRCWAGGGGTRFSPPCTPSTTRL